MVCETPRVLFTRISEFDVMHAIGKCTYSLLPVLDSTKYILPTTVRFTNSPPLGIQTQRYVLYWRLKNNNGQCNKTTGTDFPPQQVRHNWKVNRNNQYFWKKLKPLQQGHENHELYQSSFKPGQIAAHHWRPGLLYVQ